MSSIITATFQIISFFCSSGNLASSLTGFLQKYCVWKIWVFHRVVDSTETSTLCGAAFCWLLTFAVLDKPEKRTLSTQSAKSVWKFSKTWNHKFHIVVTSGLTNLAEIWKSKTDHISSCCFAVSFNSVQFNCDLSLKNNYTELAG